MKNFLVISLVILLPWSRPALASPIVNEFLDNFLGTEAYNVKVIVSDGKEDTFRPTCARRPAETLTPAATSDLFPSPLPCSAAFPWPRSKLSDGGSRPLLVVAALGSANETRTVLRNLDKTTTKCHNEVKPGYYRADNVIFFLPLDDIADISAAVFSDKEVRRHPQSALVKRIPSKGSKPLWSLERYNLYEGRTVKTAFREGKHPVRLKDVFPTYDMKGWTLRVGMLPYSYWGTADLNPMAIFLGNPRKAYTGHTGADVWAMEAACQVLGCSLEFFAPSDLIWGWIWWEDAAGPYAELTSEMIDVIIGCQYVNDRRTQIASVSHTMTLTSELTAVSKKQPPLRSVFALTKPLDLWVWLSTVIALVLTPILATLVAKAELILGYQSNFFSSIWNSFWYGFSTLLGESITEEIAMKKTWAVRWVVGAWLLFTFVATSSYSGNLMAFLVSPDYPPPIDTIGDVLNSGLPYKMVVYNDSIEFGFSLFYPELYGGKIDAAYDDFPFEEIKAVFEGKSLYIDYTALLDIAILAAFGRSQGLEVLPVHLAKKMLTDFKGQFTALYSFFFYPLNPWFRQIDMVLNRAFDAGIRDLWFERAKVELLNKYMKTIPAPLPFTIEPVLKPVSYADYKAFFMMGLAALGFTLVIFLGENIKRLRGRGIRRAHQEKSPLKKLIKARKCCIIL